MRTTADFSEKRRVQIVADLEAQYQAKPTLPQVGIASRIWQGLQTVMRAIAGSDEPQIRQLRDRNGQSVWRSYDPITGQTAYLNSEAEVRSWLEQRYYR
jgi:hypothetical protein